MSDPNPRPLPTHPCGRALLVPGGLSATDSTALRYIAVPKEGSMLPSGGTRPATRVP